MEAFAPQNCARHVSVRPHLICFLNLNACMTSIPCPDPFVLLTRGDSSPQVVCAALNVLFSTGGAFEHSSLLALTPQCSCSEQLPVVITYNCCTQWRRVPQHVVQHFVHSQPSTCQVVLYVGQHLSSDRIFYFSVRQDTLFSEVCSLGLAGLAPRCPHSCSST